MIPVMMLAVTAEESYPALNKILDDKLVNVLNRVDGVGAVSIIGAPEREVQVNVDPAKLEAYNLTVEQLGQISRRRERQHPQRHDRRGQHTFNIKADGEFKLSDEMRKVVVSNAGGPHGETFGRGPDPRYARKSHDGRARQRPAGRARDVPETVGRQHREYRPRNPVAPAGDSENPPEGCQDGADFRRLAGDHRRHRVALGDHSLRLHLRRAGGDGLPRTLARDADHLYDDPRVADLFVHLPLRHRLHAEHHLALVALHRHRYGGRRRHRGSGEHYDAYRARLEPEGGRHLRHQRGVAVGHRHDIGGRRGVPAADDGPGHGGHPVPRAGLDRDDRGLRFDYGGHFADPDDVGLPLETRRRPARLQGPRRDLQADRPGARMARRRLRPFARLGRTPPPDHLLLDDVGLRRVAGAADAGSHRVLPALGQRPHCGHGRAGAERRRRLHGAHRPADRQHHLCEIPRDRARLGVGRRQLVGQRLRGDADHRFAHHQLQRAPDRRGGARSVDLRHLRPAAR